MALGGKRGKGSCNEEQQPVLYTKTVPSLELLFCNHPAISLSTRVLKYLFKLIWHASASFLYTQNNWTYCSLTYSRDTKTY